MIFLVLLFSLTSLAAPSISTLNRNCQAPSNNGFSPRTISFQTFSKGSSVASFKSLKNYNVLLYTGLSGDLLSSGPLSVITGSKYFGTLPSSLSKKGVTHKVVDWPWGVGLASVAKNAKTIARDIRNSKKKVIIVAHSKGGADAIEALRTMYNNERKTLSSKVKAVVLLQSAFSGSPLADTLVARGASALDGVEDMQTRTRQKYIKKNMKNICRSMSFLNRSGIKVVNLLTFKQGKPSGLIVAYQRVLGLFESKSGFQKKSYHCGYNDGFIDLTEGVVPCAAVSNYVTRKFTSKQQFDHLDLAFRNKETEKIILQAIKKAL